MNEFSVGMVPECLRDHPSTEPTQKMAERCARDTLLPRVLALQRVVPALAGIVNYFATRFKGWFKERHSREML